MITLFIIGKPFAYEMENLCRVFFPQDKIVVLEKGKPEGRFISTELCENDDCVTLTVLTSFGETVEEDCKQISAASDYGERQRQMGVLLCRLLSKQLNIRPQWGILTGVRPIKLFRGLCAELGEESAVRYFREKLLVSEEKTALSLQTARAQEKIISASGPDAFSLYLSIPFCPTRCSYCSFVSQSIEHAKKLIQPYVELLEQEIALTGEIASKLGLNLQTVYMGGGTPTTLTAEQLSKVICAVKRSFDFSAVREFTVEAGRPDTITMDKLEALKEGGVDRISINPQTMNDAILERIGRKHTARQTEESFALARRAGFCHINMDTIAGLPGDTLDSFSYTFDRLMELSPESVTVHTLAKKRSASLNQQPQGMTDDAQTTGDMMHLSEKVLSAHGYSPYYLYRQSKMVGNLENVGWSRPGFESWYNIYMMEETHTVLACGAGAVTKLKAPHGTKIERIFNFKYPYEYNSRFEEMARRKAQVVSFYEQYP